MYFLAFLQTWVTSPTSTLVSLGEFFRFFLPYQDGAVFEGYRWWVSDRTFTAALSGADVRVEVAVAVVPDPSRGDQFLWDNDKFKWGDDEIVWSE